MTEALNRFTVKGLVIRTTPVGENDLLLTIFSEEMGIIKAFAAGAKSIKSKKAAATALLTYSSFTIKSKNGTYRIYEATPIAQFFTVGEEIEVLCVSQYFCELLLVFGTEGSPNTELLRLILNSLHFLTVKKRNPFLIKSITELRAASICGYAPDLVACKSCAAFETDLMYFNLSEGFLLCSSCASDTPAGMLIDKTVLSAMRHIVYSEFKKLYSFEIPENSAKLLSYVTEEYIKLQTDYNFRSLELLGSITPV